MAMIAFIIEVDVEEKSADLTYEKESIETHDVTNCLKNCCCCLLVLLVKQRKTLLLSLTSNQIFLNLSFVLQTPILVFIIHGD